MNNLPDPNIGPADHDPPISAGSLNDGYEEDTGLVNLSVRLKGIPSGGNLLPTRFEMPEKKMTEPKIPGEKAGTEVRPPRPWPKVPPKPTTPKK